MGVPSSFFVVQSIPSVPNLLFTVICCFTLVPGITGTLRNTQEHNGTVKNSLKHRKYAIFRASNRIIRTFQLSYSKL